MGAEGGRCPLAKGERILVPLDGSQFTEQVIEHALSMAAVCNSEVFLLSVIELFPEQLEVAPVLAKKMQAEAEDMLNRFKEKLSKANVSCETILHIGGHAHELIMKEARARNIDLIVMGSHGKTGLRKVFLGGVTQKVLASAPCPVLVIPFPE